MANVQKRIVREEGVVICKKFKEKTDAFSITENGRAKEIPAQPDRYLVTVASSYNVNQDIGLEDANIFEYKVSKEIFETLKYLSKVRVSYEMNSNRCVPMSVELIK